MNPKEYKYTKEHEWICPEGRNKGRMGLTDYAQSQLGDIVFLDLPAPNTQVKQSKKIGEIESVKAVSDVFSPVSGQVLEINQTTIDEPGVVNKDPYGDGWLIKIELSNPSELDALMNSTEYDKFVTELTSFNYLSFPGVMACQNQQPEKLSSMFPDICSLIGRRFYLSHPAANKGYTCEAKSQKSYGRRLGDCGQIDLKRTDMRINNVQMEVLI